MELIDKNIPAENETHHPDDPDEGRGKLIAEARKYRKRAQEAERLLDELTAQHTGELERSNARAVRFGEMLSGVVVTDRLKSVLAARGVKRVDQAAGLLAEQLDVNITEDGCQVTVRGDQQSDSNDAGSVEQVVDGWLADNNHYLPPSGDTGSGAYPGGGSPRGATIEQLDRDPVRKAEFVARYGPAALVQLARSGRKPNLR